jgi:hypothetical protein
MLVYEKARPERVVDVPAKLSARVRLFATGQAKAMLASVRPRDIAGQTRRRTPPRSWPS